MYDGQNFEINNLNGSALFGKIAAATIKNVTVRNAQITTTGNAGVIANESVSYYLANDNGNGYIATGDSKLEGCSVIGAKISATNGNVGGIIGVGGKLEGCYAQDIKITGKSQAAGGISGLPDTIKACAAKGITIEGAVNAGGIAGSLEGISVYELGNFNGIIGGSIVGSAARNIVISKSETAGGIAGLTTSNSSSAKIRSCYAANLMLNGTKSSGSISGGDYGLAYSHTIAYCIVDDTNSYTYIGGDTQRSTLNTVILKVPYSGFTVDGVLSVLNNTGSGYTGWERSDGVFDGYAYPNKINFFQRIY